MFLMNRVIAFLRARILVLIWAAMLTAGFGWLIAYEQSAGAPAEPPETWPAAARLPFDPERHNLVLFAHPKCPCTRASLAELEVVMTRCAREVKSTICFFYPPGESITREETSLVHAARQIPGLTVIIDYDGTIAERFGALTSGQAMLFDQQQKRIFAGGITGARGHEGDNQGRALLLALAKGETCSPGPTPVYGCALRTPLN
jgi:hypothetical protein